VVFTTEDIDTFFNGRPAPRTQELEKLRVEKEVLTRTVATLNKENDRLRADNEKLRQRLERVVASNHPGVAK
jgi:regulator of replication initiation timing